MKKPFAAFWALSCGLTLGVAFTLTTLAQTSAPATRPTTNKAPITPANLADLRLIQQRVEDVVKKSMPATVAVMAGSGQGSGVIVSKDGWVLTAGHVTSEANRDISLILADGRRVKARTYGINLGIDSGLIKITDKGDYPFVPLGTNKDMKAGQWVVALGHPGGYRKERPPVVRLGRVLMANSRMVGTDCTLIMGDSGGPLFDLDGNLIGIHSRIGAQATVNIHVPVDTYTQTWDRLANSETWGGGMLGLAGAPKVMMGVLTEEHERGAKVVSLIDNGPAAKAGLKPGDIILKLGESAVKGPDELLGLMGRYRAGETVKLIVDREGKTEEVSVKLAARPANMR